jgi:hypothetical protein
MFKSKEDLIKEPDEKSIDEKDTCDICGKPLGDDTYHMEETVGHYLCITKKFGS